MKTTTTTHFNSARTEAASRPGASAGELATLTLAVVAVIGLSSLML